jgi:hypothetical protein
MPRAVAARKFASEEAARGQTSSTTQHSSMTVLHHLARVAGLAMRSLLLLRLLAASKQECA